ncbi:MAG: DNA repair protein RecN [Ignavibacteriae bacterium]|nr:DNA repair protein RecN [Ignavibacteriota bacterium]
MIAALTIKHFALIEELRIELGHGLTVITGETGAGKSIVVDALGLALGERADADSVRDGAAKAVIEAEFHAADLRWLEADLAALGVEWQDPLILRREVAAKGSSRCFINDSPVTVSQLKSVGDRLVDIHGQHEHQSLLRPEAHLTLLDAFGGHAPLLETYEEAYSALSSAAKDLEKAYRDRERLEERRAVLDMHLREIGAVDPQSGEDDDIERELRIAEHAEKIATLGNNILGVLFDGEQNATDQLGRARRDLADLTGIDPALASLEHELSSAAAGIDETVRTLRTYTETIDFSPARCEALRTRLAELLSLKRKYRCTLPELLDKRDELRRERDSLENIDATIETLQAQLRTQRADASEKAEALTAARTRAAGTLGKDVARALKDLGIQRARFETRIEQRAADTEPFLEYNGRRVQARPDGADAAEFYLSANVGEDVRPLAKVASGGEVSRIMLAMKSLFAGRSPVPVMVFDEIDTGVSGAVAHKVGRAMHDLARRHQILAITHLPQIAAAGAGHLVVEKVVHGARTSTHVRRLETSEREHEIARLISGDHVTPAAERTARDLLADFRTG